MRFERRVARERHSCFRRGIKAAMTFSKLSSTRPPIWGEKKKRKKERNNFENCGDDDCAEERNFFFSRFSSYCSNFENGDDARETTAWKIKILYIFFFFRSNFEIQYATRRKILGMNYRGEFLDACGKNFKREDEEIEKRE